MPKTSIYADSDDPGGEQRIRCEIGWAKGYDVQIAVTRLADGLEPGIEFVPSTGNTTITVSGGATQGGTTTVSGEPQSAWQGQRMSVTRSQINSLIRTLRDARDVAYGRDE